jgi:flagellar basal body-associated protein FliL
MFSRKNLPEKKLEHIEQVSEDKHRPESELAKEINSDYKENMLWITLYVLLIIVIIGLLAYKLLVYKSLL